MDDLRRLRAVIDYALEEHINIPRAEAAGREVHERISSLLRVARNFSKTVHARDGNSSRRPTCGEGFVAQAPA